MENKNTIIKSGETSDNQWSDLEELGKKGFNNERKLTETRPETPEEKQAKTQKSTNAVLAAYKKIEEKISSAYDNHERFRINKIKDDTSLLVPPVWSKPDEWTDSYIENRPPSIPRKMARIAMDALGIKIKKDEERRMAEDMRMARREIWQSRIDEYEKETLEEQERITKREAEAKQKEQEDLLAGMQEMRAKKAERLRKQRIQELVERDLNSRLLKIDSLEEEVYAGNPEVQKHEELFQGEKIPVYDLKGFPYSILSTTIDYQKNGGKVGTETSEELIDDPSIWTKRRDEVEGEEGWGVSYSSKTKGNTIFGCYTSSEHNMDNRTRGELVYGFEDVEADSIIFIHKKDGSTPNNIGDVDTKISNIQAIDALERVDDESGPYEYNQIDLRRYSENGTPKKPDYLIVENGRITKTVLRHAKYFKIPIINIVQKSYYEKMRDKGEQILNSITNDDDYLEIDRKLAALESISLYRGKYRGIERIGRKEDEESLRRLDDKEYEILKIELAKRVDFIKDTLNGAISRIKDHTKKGLAVTDVEAFPEFRSHLFYIRDIQNGLARLEDADGRMTDGERRPGAYNFIDVSFRLNKKGSRDVTISTRIYDGERPYKSNNTPELGRPTEEDLDKADSSFYNELEPTIIEYFNALRENRSL